MKLYRGDKILNESTNPGIYRNNGIRSKAFGSGASPANIELQGLLQSITKHVKPATKEDIVYYDVTDFISFSENQERARYWCSDRGTLILEECQDFLETRYIFTMEIPDSELQNHGNGIYSFKYKCNKSCSRQSRMSTLFPKRNLSFLNLNKFPPISNQLSGS